MHKYRLKCPACSLEYAPDANHFRCKTCDAPTVVNMNLNGRAGPLAGPETSMWRYFEMLPVDDRKRVLSQGEGWTPLVDAPGLAHHLGVDRLLLKNETVNPTGSFKDRQVSVGLTKALESGAANIAVFSSGNVAAAASSYAALAGVACHVFTPSNAPDNRLVQARMYGAVHYRVRTLSSSRIFALISRECRRRNWYLLSTAGLYNPFHVEGAKTLAYELYEQSDEMPDWVIAPVGGGGLLGGIWRGFEELKALGKIKDVPKLVGVQSEACPPLVQAINKGLTPKEVLSKPVQVGETIAGAIADDVLFDAYTVLPAIRSTGGTALGIADREMLEAESLAAKRAGIFAEPAGASPIAGLARMLDTGRIGKKDRVCCVITGSGFKDMGSAKEIVDSAVDVEPTEQAFEALA